MFWLRLGRFGVCVGAALIIGACNKSPASAVDNTPPIETSPAPESEASITENLDPSPLIVARPSHNYDERDGWTYYYVAAVSEKERENGVATGHVSGFQFLGRNEKGQFILASIRSNGTVNYRAKCSRPCRIIDTNDGDKIAFSTDSIIGAAFEDAFNGKLEIAKWATDEALSKDTPGAPASGIAPGTVTADPEGAPAGPEDNAESKAEEGDQSGA